MKRVNRVSRGKSGGRTGIGMTPEQSARLFQAFSQQTLPLRASSAELAWASRSVSA